MPEGKESWSLEELVDFEVGLHQSPETEAEVGKEIRDGLRSRKFGPDETSKRRWGFKQWLKALPALGAGRRVISSVNLVGGIVLVLMFLSGVGLIRGLVGDVRGTDLRGFNIWVFLAGTLGVQWLLIIGGIFGILIIQRFTGRFGWLKEIVARGVQRLAGRVDEGIWKSLTEVKSGQQSALGWRLGRVLQVGGIGFNLGLLAGFFGMLWFTQVSFYWESTLPQFGATTLEKTTRFLALGIPGISPGEMGVGVTQLGAFEAAEKDGFPSWETFLLFALFVWGLLPRIGFWVLAFCQEKKALGALKFQDPQHRKLWRELTKVERSVVIEGPSDGVVLLDVGGLNLEPDRLRPFLLQTLRVNPENTYAVSVLDAAEEREAWEAIKKAPCGVVMLVEAWSLSPKQMVALVDRIRKEAGEKTVLRFLVLGDGVEAPPEEEYQQWQIFSDGLRDDRLECVAYEDRSLES